MMKNRITIKTDEQLQNCFNAKLAVEVWFVGVLDCVSTIKSFDDEIVVVEDGMYFRSNCVLLMKGSHLQLVK